MAGDKCLFEFFVHCQNQKWLGSMLNNNSRTLYCPAHIKYYQHYPNFSCVSELLGIQYMLQINLYLSKTLCYLSQLSPTWFILVDNVVLHQFACLLFFARWGSFLFQPSRSKNLVNKTNNVAADAAFKSRSKRDVMNLGDAKHRPAPCMSAHFCPSIPLKA